MGLLGGNGSKRANGGRKRVLIVDDSRRFRDEMASLLARESGVEVVGMAEDGQQAVEMAARLRPDIIIMDQKMPGLTGVQATARIREHGVPAQIYFVVGDPAYRTQALRAGADQYFLKGTEVDDLLQTIRAAGATAAEKGRPAARATGEAGTHGGQWGMVIGTSLLLLALLAGLWKVPRAVLPTVGLSLGFLFFLYALKYYASVGLILFASASNGNGNGNGHNGNGKRRNGRGLANGNGHRNGRGLNGHANGNGLKPVLAHKPFVSIHLPMYNEKAVVDRLLTACTSLEYDGYEVIVADDSTDDTTEILRQRWGSHPRVKISHRTNRKGFKGGALQEALKKTDPRAEFIAVFDADFIPPPGILDQFLAYFYGTNGHNGDEAASGHAGGNGHGQAVLLDERVGVVQGYQWHVLNASENWITRAIRSEYSGSYVVERGTQELVGAMKMISGSVFMIRASVLRRLGWRTSITEDWELTLRLYLEGFKVLYTPFVQAPAECVSGLRQLIRQRMRWAEGHTYNVKKYFWQVMTSHLLSWKEKLEFLYYAPYYLQAAVFMVGTAAWLLSELVFRHHLPFWSDMLGWSLVFTNVFSLGLMNLSGLFLERGVRRGWLGLLSFLLLTYLLVPYQAYAALKGLLEPHEGGWHRTQKTGVITEVVERLGHIRRLSPLKPKKKQRSIDLGKRLGLPGAASRWLQLPPRFRTGRWGLAQRLAGGLLIGLLILGFLWARMPGAEAARGRTPGTLYFHADTDPYSYMMVPEAPSGTTQAANGTTLSFYSDSFSDAWLLNAGDTNVSLWSLFEPGETEASLELSYGSGSSWTSLGRGSLGIRDSFALYEGSFATSEHAFSDGERLRLSITLPPNAYAWWDGTTSASSVVLPVPPAADFRLAYLLVTAFAPVATIEVTRRRRLVVRIASTLLAFLIPLALAAQLVGVAGAFPDLFTTEDASAQNNPSGFTTALTDASMSVYGPEEAGGARERLDLRSRNSETRQIFVDGHPSNQFIWEGSSAPIHYQDAQGAWQEIDANLVRSSGSIAGFGTPAWEMTENDYEAYILGSLNEGLPLVRYAASDSRYWVQFAPQNLQWTNASGQTETIATPTTTSTLVSGNEARWRDVYAPGIDLRLVTGAERLQEWLELAHPLPAPPESIREGQDPAFEFVEILSFQEDLTIWVDGAAWEEAGDIVTSGDVVFRDPNGDVAFAFPAPFVSDAASKGITAQYHLSRQGDSLTIAVQVPLSWLESAIYPLSIDPTIDRSVGASSDDCDRMQAVNWTCTFLGVYLDYPAANQSDGMRFPNVAVSSGATISTAYLTVRARTTVSGPTGGTTIYGQAHDNPPTFSTYTEYDSRVRTTASVHWAPSAWVSGTDYNSPGISTIIQEIINRPGWARGNAMALFFVADQVQDINGYAYDGSATYAPRLHIEYSIYDSFTRTVAASSDDCDHDNVNWTTTSTTFYLDWVSANYDQSDGLRFTNVTIPADATIVTAYLRVRAWHTPGSITGGATIYGQAADNPSTFSTRGDYEARQWTSASVYWRPSTWVLNTVHDSPDIRTVVQEIVDRPGWASGQAMAFKLQGDETQNIYGYAWDYNGNGVYAPQLYVEYTVAPSAPSNCQATYISDTQINVGWSDNSYNETGFRIESSVDGAAFSQIGTQLANSTSYSDTSTSADHSYQYRVRATNAAGDSAYCAGTPTIYTSPDPPTAVTATRTGDREITLSWTDQSQYEDRFRIERSKNGGAYSFLADDLDGSPFVDSTITQEEYDAGDSFTYRVRAEISSQSLVSSWAFSNTVVVPEWGIIFLALAPMIPYFMALMWRRKRLAARLGLALASFLVLLGVVANQVGIVGAAPDVFYLHDTDTSGITPAGEYINTTAPTDPTPPAEFPAGPNYRSIGTNSGTLYSTGNASIQSGQTTVTFDGGASLPAPTAVGAVGVGDKLVIGSETFFILSRDSATQVTVQTAASTTHTNESYSITRAYNSFQAWEDPCGATPCLPTSTGGRGGNLVGENRIEVGVAYMDGTFTPTAMTTFNDSTPDATHYMRLTVAPGQRHNGTAGTGVYVNGGSMLSGSVFWVRDPYVRIEWLEIGNYNGNAVSGQPINVDEGTAGNNLFSHLIIHDYTSNSGRGAINIYETVTVRNSIFYSGDVGLRTYSAGTPTVTVENVTIYGMSGDGFFAGVNGGTTTYILKNIISVGSGGQDFDLDQFGAVVDPTSGYNLYSDVHLDVHPGSNNQSPPASLEDLFVSIVSTSENLHLEAGGHNAIDNGVSLAGSFTVDIDNQTRPYRAGWDIGADECLPFARFDTVSQAAHWYSDLSFPTGSGNGGLAAGDYTLNMYFARLPTAGSVDITVSVQHTKPDGTDAQLITSASTTITSGTTDPLALSLGTGAAQTFTAADPRRLRVQITVTGVSGGGSFSLAYDVTADPTNLQTPALTLPEWNVIFFVLVPLVPLLMSLLWQRKRLAARLGLALASFLLLLSLVADRVGLVAAAPDIFYLRDAATSGITPPGRTINNSEGAAAATMTFDSVDDEAYWYTDLTYPTGSDDASIAAGDYSLNMYFSQLPSISPPQVDASSSGDTRPASLTISHTTGSGSNRLMLVGISFINDELETVSSVTYNGVSLTKVGEQDSVDDARVEIWRLIAPPAGTYNVVITFSAPLRRVATAGVMTFSGVDQTTPLGTFASAFSQSSTGTASVNVSSAAGELVFDTVASSNCSLLNVGSGQTERWNLTQPDGMFPSVGGGSTEPGAASVTMSWGQGFAEPWAIGAVSIKPVAAAPIAFDAASEGNTGSTPVGTLTVPHTVVSNTNGILVVGVNIFSFTDPVPTVSTMTYAGQTMAFLATAIDPGVPARIRTEMWYILAPATGTNDIYMTFSSNVVAVAGGMSYTGVHQTTPFGTAVPLGGNGTTVSVNVSSAAGELVVDTVGTRQSATGGQTLTAGAGQQERYNDVTAPSGDSNVVGAGSEEAGAASVTMSWTVGPEGARWAIVAAPLRPAGALAVDSASSGQTQRTSLTISHTTSGAQRLMLVGVSINSATDTVSGITYNGVPLTRKGYYPFQPRVEIWYLVAPPTGTHDVVITFDANLNQGAKAGVVTFTGVDQTTPLGTFAQASGTSTTATLDVSSAANELIFDTVGCEAVTDACTSLTVGAGQTQRWNRPEPAGMESFIAAGSTEPGAASVTMSWTIGGTANAPWTIGAVPIKPAAASVDVTVSVYHTDADGSSPVEIVTSATTSIDPTTANPYALSIGAGSAQTFTAADPQRLRVLVDVTAVNGGASFTLAYDSGANPSSLDTPVLTVLDRTLILILLAGMIPIVTIELTRRRRLASRVLGIAASCLVALGLLSGQVGVAVASPDVFYLRDTTSNGASPAGRDMNTTEGSVGSTQAFSAPGSTYWYQDVAWPTGADDAAIAAGPYTANLNFSSLPSTSPPQVDAASSGDTRAASLTISHTTGSGSNRLMLVGISFINDELETVSSVTYNGVGLTKVGEQNSDDDARIEIWSLLAPPTGTYDVVITFSAPLRRGATAGVMTFTGVNQTTPLGTFASAFSQSSSGTASVNVSSAAGELVFDTVASSNCSFLNAGSGQTERWNLTQPDGQFPSVGGGSTEPGAATVIMSWGQGFARPWAIGGVSIKPVAAAPIAFDAPSQGHTGSAAVSSLTVPHTVVSNTNGILVVGVNIFSALDPFPYVLTMTYAGQTMIFVAAVNDVAAPNTRVRSEMWYVTAPTTGTNDILITFSKNANAVAGGVSYTGVHQTTPFGTPGTNTGNSMTPSVSVSSAAGELVVDTVGIRQTTAGDQTLTVDPTQTQRYNDVSLNSTIANNVVGAGSQEAGASSVTMSWTAGYTRPWTIVAAPLKPAGSSAPVVDSTSSGQTLRTSLTISHTTAGAQRLMLVGVSINASTDTVSGITYNGVPLTRKGYFPFQPRVEIWYLVAPPTGTHDVVITFDANLNQGAKAGVMTFTGVDQTTPLGTFAQASGTSTTATVNVTSAANELIFDTVGCEAVTDACTSLTVGAGQTQRWNRPEPAGMESFIAAGSTEPGAASVTMSWTIGGTANAPWTIGAVPIKPAAASVDIAVSIHHTRADGSDPQLITSASTTITSGTTDPLALSLGSGALQTFTSADPRRLRLQIEVTAVSGGGSFVLDYDGTCASGRCSSLETPVVTIPEWSLALLVLVPLVPTVTSLIWQRRRLAARLALVLASVLVPMGILAQQVGTGAAAPDVFYLHDSSPGSSVAFVEVQTGGDGEDLFSPDGDVAVTNWTDSSGNSIHFDDIDETTNDDDTTYTQTSAASGDTGDDLTVSLANLADPLSNVYHVVQYRWRNAGNSTGDAALAFSMELLQGNSVIASRSHSSAEVASQLSYTTFTYTLTPAEADSITDYNDLRIRFNVTTKSAGSSGSRILRVTWAAFTVNWPLSVSTSANLTAVPNQLYLAAISTKNGPPVVQSVSGLGLTWSFVDRQCGGRNQTMVEVWSALGTPTGDGVVTATFDVADHNAVISVSRYSGVNTADPIGAVNSANSNGVNGACSGGTDALSGSVNLTTTAADSYAYGAFALRNRDMTGGTGYQVRNETYYGLGGEVAGVGTEDRLVATASTVAVDASFSSNLDWAVVAVEIKVGGVSPAGRTMNISQGVGASTMLFDSAGQNAYWYADQTWPTGSGDGGIAAGNYTLNMYFNERPRAWWNANYQYRQQITVTAGASNVPTGYSIRVQFDHQSLVTGSKSLSSGNDIRIVYWNGSSWTELDRRIDDQSSWNSTTTQAWFRTQAAINASASDSNYYMYYGYSSAGTPPTTWSNIFLFYDDFNDGSFDALRWENPWGTCTESGGNMTLNSASSVWATTTYALGTDTMWEGRVQLGGDGQEANFDLWAATNTTNWSDDWIVFWTTDTTSNRETGNEGTGSNATYTPITPTSFHLYAFARIGTSSVPFYRDGALLGTGNTDIPDENLRIFAGNSTSYSVIYDFVRVRRYVSSEPTTSFGSEATSADVRIVVTVSHTAPDGSGATTIVSSSTTTINSSTANPYALSIGSGALQTFTSSDPRRLRVQVNVSSVNGGERFVLAYDSGTDPSNLATPVVTVPEWNLAFLALVPLIPLVMSTLWRRRRLAGRLISLGLACSIGLGLLAGQVVPASANPDVFYLHTTPTSGLSPAGEYMDLIEGTNTATAPMQVTATSDTTTTSTTDVAVSGMSITPGAGDYHIWFSGSVEAAATSYQYVSLYVNGVQLGHTERQSRTESSIPATSFPVATHARVTGVLAGQAIEVRWRTSASTATMHERTLVVVPIVAADSSQASATLDATTPSTIDVLVPDMTITPGAGDYLIWFSGSVQAAATSYQYVSIYVNNVQLAHTERQIYTESSIPATSFPVATHARVTGVLAGEAIEVRWRTSASTATMHQRTLVVSRITAADSTQAGDTADTTTTSATDVLVNTMTITPGAGDYLIWFSGSVESANGATTQNQYVSLYVNGAQVAHTERQITQEESLSNTAFPVATHAYVTCVGAGQAIEVRWRTTGGYTATMHERTLVVQRLPPGGTRTFNSVGSCYWYHDVAWPTGGGDAAIAAGSYTASLYFNSLPAAPGFPQVAATNTSSTATASTSLVVNLPSGIQAGNLLVALVSAYQSNGSNVDITWPAGWTEFFERDATSGTVHLAISGAWRQATGSEGATVTATANQSVTGAHQSYRITGAADPAVQPPEVITNAYTTAGTSINPQALTPTGGAKNYLWLAVAGWRDATLSATVNPTNYTNAIEASSGGITPDGTRLRSLRRELNAASEDPTTFTLSANSDRRAGATIAIHPPSPSVSITVSVHHTAAGGSGATLITSASTTITPSTADPLALSLGSGALQTFTAADPRRLRMQIEVTGVTSGGSFVLDYDGTCASSRCSNLATPVVTVPEGAVALIPIGLLIPMLVSVWWRGQRPRGRAGWDERRPIPGRRLLDAPLKWQAWLWQLLTPRFIRRRRG